MIIVVLVVLGLCFGSFINALVWRIHKQSKAKSKKKASEYSISKGRSQCVHCGHVLAAKDLLPVISWLSLRGKCRYCSKKISWQYPLVEALTAALFVASYIWWPTSLESGLQIASFVTWLVALVGLVALCVYDLRWMILPNRIVFPMGALAAFSAVLTIVDKGTKQSVVEVVSSVLIGGGLFYLLFQISKGKWIGGGDVKLGFVLGALIALPAQAALMLFIASMLGTIVSLPMVINKKLTPSTRVPFGPFLIAATIIVKLFGASILDWYLHTFVGI